MCCTAMCQLDRDGYREDDLAAKFVTIYVSTVSSTVYSKAPSAYNARAACKATLILLVAESWPLGKTTDLSLQHLCSQERMQSASGPSMAREAAPAGALPKASC
eukprot:scaffold1034_cov418-Prasinococcus_capsulatus_cf.AAC.18